MDIEWNLPGYAEQNYSGDLSPHHNPGRTHAAPGPGPS